MDAASLLARLAEAPSETALVLDVDGTLAPIVPRPEDAAVPAATRVELTRLAGRYLLVACLSGRAGEDAARIVGVGGVRYVGNHGLELAADREALLAAIARFRESVDGVWPVEDKGLSLSFHYREAPDEDEARAALAEVEASARVAGLVPRWGRKVLEVRPDVKADKGTAVTALVVESGARRALYAGDDTTDLDAFAALAAAGLDHVVRVAVTSAEAPAGLAAAADLVVPGPEAVAELLGRL